MTYCWKCCSRPIKQVTMLYVIHDILLKVALNTNKCGHHAMRNCYTWHIVVSGVQHQLNLTPCYVITDILLKVALSIQLATMLYVITDILLKVALPIQLVTILYVITDILLKVALNTNKCGHHAMRNSWQIVESGVKLPYNWSPCYTLYLTYCWK